ncbi:MAG: hypothetical protein ACXVJT_14285, partial [Thermoanaerobaculia bacterium]
RVPAAVSITDLYRSILGAARVVEGEPTMAIADERLRRPAIASYQVQAGRRVEAGISATLDRYHYILWRDGREALFDDVSDPAESAPIPTRSGAGAAIVTPLRELAARAATRHSSTDFNALGYIQ